MQNQRTDYVLLSLGVVLVIIPLIFAVSFTAQFESVQLYMRLIASLGGALIGAWLPGLFQLRIPGIRAGGAFAVLVLFWLFNPPQTLNRAVTGAIEGDKKTLEMTQIPDLSQTTIYEATDSVSFTARGDTSINNPENAPAGFINVAVMPSNNKDNSGIEYIQEIYPHYYMSVRMGGDSSIGTLELQGLGPENNKIHFIVSNLNNRYFLWAGEKNTAGWFELKNKTSENNNTLGMYQYGRYVVLFFNNVRVASFDTLIAQGPGRVGVAYKRQRKSDGSLTDPHHSAQAWFDGFTVYQFGKAAEL